MNDNPNQLIRRECDRCGANLKESNQNGKYYCEYCGAVYFERTYDSSNDWRELIEEPVNDEDMESVIENDKGIQTGNNRKIIVSVALFLIFCFGISILTFRSGSISSIFSTSNASSTRPEIDKPKMLTTLPEAENAGTPVAYEGWELSVSPRINISHNRIYFNFSIQNWSDDYQQLTYIPKEIIVYDNLGNQYELSLGNCEPDIPYLPRQITFSPNEKITFQSNRSWCNNDENIPPFTAVINPEVTNLFFHFRDFGVFKNITFIFDL